MKRGVLVFDKESNRYDICFGFEDYYGGLHCGESFEVFVDGKWMPTRIEMNGANNDWYLVGISVVDLRGLGVRI
ncbi:MAG: DUF5348 domain-containing protein [Clostridia bacterium]|nr:DUF5348 domain-containing protein [Clostridia bacterium]